MIIGEDDCFPRGGKINFSQTKPVKRKFDDNLFNNKSKAVKTKKRRKQHKEIETPEEGLWPTVKLEGTLTYNKIQEGMTILCCIKRITNFSLQVEFPGLTFGTILINQISQEFNEKLSQLKTEHLKSVQDMLQLGQLLPAKIISVAHSEKGPDVQASIAPKTVNFNKNHNSFNKGGLIWANVVSELDHGFELTVGVANCRVFLPFENVDETVKLIIGQPLYCVIQKRETCNLVTTLSVSAKQKHVNEYKSESLSLDDIIPGTKVKFLVEEILPNGIKGSFFENYFGFIDESQIFNKVNLQRVKEGKTLDAYVLYTEPITKITYLTLRGLNTLPGPEIPIGKKFSVKVTKITSRGVCVQLENNKTGFVTNKRLINSLPKDTLDVMEAVTEKYNVGSKHKCRVLDYNYIGDLYICTFEKEIVQEKVFTIWDLKLGQAVIVKIDKITDKGLVVKTGHVQGFVPNLHLSDAHFSENIKAKFSPGMNVKAKVIKLMPQNVIFTLKQGLVNSDKVLQKIEDAVIGSFFTGFVVQIKEEGALIAFCEDIAGWLSNQALKFDNSEEIIDPRKYLFLGQCITVCVVGIKNGKLQLSLNDSVSSDGCNKPINLGKLVSGVIKEVHSDRVDVEVGKNKNLVSIPVSHLSDDLNVCSLILTQLKPEIKLKNLLCINSLDSVPIVSRKEFRYLQNKTLKFYNFDELNKNLNLRCWFAESDDSGIYVVTPVKKLLKKIFIPFERIEIERKFEPYDVVYTKVLNVDLENKNIELSVSSDDKSSPLNKMIETMEDVQFANFLFGKNNPALVAIKIGSTINSTINKVKIKNCYVSLKNGLKGIIPKKLASDECKVGSNVKGFVLDYNLTKNCLVICPKNKINQQINKTQDDISEFLNTVCFAKVLFVTKCYAIAILIEEHSNKQLIFLPRDKNTKYVLNKEVKIVVHGIIGGRIIGVPTKYVTNIKKIKKVKKEKLKKKPIEVEIITKDEVISVDENINEETLDDEEEEEEMEVETKPQLDSKVVLSGPKSFYSLENNKAIDTSSDEDEEEQRPKKKKLTAAERIELIREEEKRIEKIEKELADNSTNPQTADQFDRLLLANPNSSELWLKYIAMHVAATELEKARAVGKKAIETINPVLIEEKLNVWIALLTLENTYGTSESFDKVFEDAVKFNDSLDVYLSVIKMFAESGKLSEMEEKIRKLRHKEKQNTKMWLEIGRIYYSLQKFKEARNLKEAALKSILDKKRQFDLIIRFGIMEFQFGELEQAIANFEAILETYPAKVNIWTVYVDQLVKRKKIDEARKVLERAINQKFAIKTMKVLFQKFVSFEEMHGNSENLANVKKRAKEFVASLGVK